MCITFFSWSPRSWPRERHSQTPLPPALPHLPALLEAQEMARLKATPTPPIVWVPPLAPWDFGQVAHAPHPHCIMRTPSPHPWWLWGGPGGPSRLVPPDECPGPAGTFQCLPGCSPAPFPTVCRPESMVGSPHGLPSPPCPGSSEWSCWAQWGAAG